MYKLLAFLLMTVVIVALFALQADEEVAMQALFQGKHAVNRAAHAAAQQLDPEALSHGVVAIDPSRAADTAMLYLQHNMRLDASNVPLPGTFWRTRVDVVAFEVIQQVDFPYTYRNDAYAYEVTLDQPGVVLIARLVYPRMFSVLGPITWNVKGAAELLY